MLCQPYFTVDSLESIVKLKPLSYVYINCYKVCISVACASAAFFFFFPSCNWVLTLNVSLVYNFLSFIPRLPRPSRKKNDDMFYYFDIKIQVNDQ